MRRDFCTLGLALMLLAAPAFADAAPDRRMRTEDKLVLAAVVAGSIAVTAIGAFVHWKLLRPPKDP
jgi:hypothetical protein